MEVKTPSMEESIDVKERLNGWVQTGTIQVQQPFQQPYQQGFQQPFPTLSTLWQTINRPTTYEVTINRPQTSRLLDLQVMNKLLIDLVRMK